MSSTFQLHGDTRPTVLLGVTTYPDGGGISSILENYVGSLSERFDVHVAIAEAGEGGVDHLPLSNDRIHIAPTMSWRLHPILFPTSLIFAARTTRFLGRTVATIQPDVLIIQDALNLPVPGVLSTRRRPTKLVIMDHGTLTNVYEPEWLNIVTEQTGPIKTAVFKALFHADAPWRSVRWKLGVGLADGVWYTGHELEPYFARAGRRAAQYGQTIPPDFKPPSAVERRSARARLDLHGDDLIVANVVGRLDGEKGLRLIVGAVSQLAPSFPQLRVLIAGAGRLDKWLSSEIDELGLAEVIRPLGRLDRDEVRRLHHASDLHIYAGTISCGLSMCLIEAMASGVLPVVSDVPRAQRELVEGVGRVVPAGDQNALEEALACVLSLSARERKTMGSAAAVRVHEKTLPSVPELVAELVM